MSGAQRPLRVALLAFRGNPHSGGQGVYVRQLSKALAGLGHHVEVLAGPPYPDLDPAVTLTRLPSLDLYRPEDPFRRPELAEYRSVADVAESAIALTGGYPEPLAFSLRALATLRRRRREFDIVHDNQCLGYGVLGIPRLGLPTVATVHHPMTIDRSIELAHAHGFWRRVSVYRWFGFARMQARVARMLPRVITVSDIAYEDLVREFKVRPERVKVIANGVEPDVFRPMPGIERIPGRLITTASADAPLKGLVPLLEALAKLRTERDVELLVIGKPRPEGPAPRAIEQLGLAGIVRFVSELDQSEMPELYATAQVAVIPSLYEGFSLPALEAMACEVPLVATRVGALPQILGDGRAGMLVPPGDPAALGAAVRTLLDDAELRARMGAAGRERVTARYTWEMCAQATADEYRFTIARAGR